MNISDLLRRLEALERAVTEVRHGSADQAARLAPQASESNEYDAVLTAALSRGTKTTPTSAAATLWYPASAGSGPLVDSTIPITVYDYGDVPEAGLAVGVKIRVRKLWGVWRYDGGC